MTSRQLRSRLAEALDIIAAVERYLEKIDYAATGWGGVALQHRVADFMDRHRDERESGCAL
ncbi:hypothetical protein W911_03680 [Hyphomicrobium nitrativorans NL23]|uniref:Uncharacterized protein n=1 Tax=Hyphomicrobium nitrativorans NL23 TaxID=1029756 RepID=V5SIL1_9HYPH|nr:hypothetical protein [Hyphomicrobium nitrativorans]AHB49905.1 hypothetical protein W911_03680 [Hyphomicrobium nitrativorans NL23]